MLRTRKCVVQLGTAEKPMRGRFQFPVAREPIRSTGRPTFELVPGRNFESESWEKNRLLATPAETSPERGEWLIVWQNEVISRIITFSENPILRTGAYQSSQGHLCSRIE